MRTVSIQELTEYVYVSVLKYILYNIYIYIYVHTNGCSGISSKPLARLVAFGHPGVGNLSNL